LLRKGEALLKAMRSPIIQEALNNSLMIAEVLIQAIDETMNSIGFDDEKSHGFRKTSLFVRSLPEQ
jgi:hypothetical protein